MKKFNGIPEVIENYLRKFSDNKNINLTLKDYSRARKKKLRKKIFSLMWFEYALKSNADRIERAELVDPPLPRL